MYIWLNIQVCIGFRYCFCWEYIYQYCYCFVWEYGICNDIEISYRDGGGKNEVVLNNFNVKLIYYDIIKFIML